MDRVTEGVPATEHPVVIIGAGPAGLTAAYELVKRDVRPLVLEQYSKVGGISRTESHKGYRFDIGGHRFFTKVDEVNALWQEVMGDEFLKVPRLSRIYYRERFYSYPLELKNTLSNLGPIESVRILLSFFKWKIRPYSQEENFEEWVTNRFGGRLYWLFFKSYTEKVWGIPCDKIQAEWAAQRIKGLSLTSAVINALFGKNDTKTLIKEFDYPRFGPGMMWERFASIVERKGGRVDMNTDVVAIKRDGKRITSVVVKSAEDETPREIAAENFISSMPITELIAKMDPPPPAEVLEAAKGLSYRDFLVVTLIVDKPDLFPDNWVYVHNPGVKVGRIQNFFNWSPAMVPDKETSSLGMEYFCSEGDEIWEMPDADLTTLAGEELGKLGLAKDGKVVDSAIIRQKKAYPVYDRDYRKHLTVIQKFIESLENFQTVGRNGMHRYNNQDHSMLTAILAVRNLFGEKNDLWNVNTERSYHEDFTKEDLRKKELSKDGLPAGQDKVLAAQDLERVKVS